MVCNAVNLPWGGHLQLKMGFATLGAMQALSGQLQVVVLSLAIKYSMHVGARFKGRGVRGCEGTHYAAGET